MLKLSWIECSMTFHICSWIASCSECSRHLLDADNNKLSRLKWNPLCPLLRQWGVQKGVHYNCISQRTKLNWVPKCLAVWLVILAINSLECGGPWRAAHERNCPHTTPSKPCTASSYKNLSIWELWPQLLHCMLMELWSSYIVPC